MVGVTIELRSADWTDLQQAPHMYVTIFNVEKKKLDFNLKKTLGSSNNENILFGL